MKLQCNKFSTMGRVLPINWHLPFFLFLFFLSFLLRFIYHAQESTICRDGTIYVTLAEKWLQTGNYPFHYYLPLYPWLMKLLMHCGMSGYAAGVGINLFLGSLLPLVCYGIIRQITVRREIALAGALLTAVHPLAIELSANVQRDIPYLFFTGGAIFCGLHAVKCGKWYWWSFCSLFLALGIFSRYETLELLPLILLYFPLAPLCRALSWKKAALSFLVWSISLAFFLAGLIGVMNVGEQMSKAYQGRIERILNKKC